MTPQELIAFRARMGWDRTELARQLEISPSRLADYEMGATRGRGARPAPIPKVVELACRYLAAEMGPRRRGPPPAGFSWLAPGLPKHTPTEAAARLLELRRGAVLPPDVTIKELIERGRD